MDGRMIMKYESSNDAHGISHPHPSHALFQRVCMCVCVRVCGHTFYASHSCKKIHTIEYVCVFEGTC